MSLKPLYSAVDFICGAPFLAAGFCYQFVRGWFIAGRALYQFCEVINKHDN